MLKMTYRQYIITGMNNSPRERQMKKPYTKETICIQSGWKPGNGEPRVLPIYQSHHLQIRNLRSRWDVLFDLEEEGYFYTRLQNPTNDCVAQKICELEGGVAAMLTSSGQRLTIMPYLISVRRGIILSFLRLCMEEPLTSSQ